MQERESTMITPPVESGYSYADAKVAPTSDERLAEIERRLKDSCPGHRDESGDWVYCYCFEDFETDGLALITEVRRLRRDLKLAQLSRGVPAPWGQAAEDIENLRRAVGRD